MSILRDFQKSNSDWGKSLPTTPTSLTGEKKLAPTAAYDAEPPNKSECSSTGVLTVSSAMEPTTKRDIIQRSDIRSQKLFASASILDDICGFEQTGNDGDTAGAGIEDLFEVLELYSADAKDRQRDRDMHA